MGDVLSILPSGYLTWPWKIAIIYIQVNHQKTSINGPCSTAMLNNQRVYLKKTINNMGLDQWGLMGYIPSQEPLMLGFLLMEENMFNEWDMEVNGL